MMTVKDLYKYQRVDGGYDVSPIQPDVDYETMYRIIAGEGKLVTIDGENAYACIDVTSADNWYEIDDPDWIPERDPYVG